MCTLFLTDVDSNQILLNATTHRGLHIEGEVCHLRLHCLSTWRVSRCRWCSIRRSIVRTRLTVVTWPSRSTCTWPGGQLARRSSSYSPALVRSWYSSVSSVTVDTRHQSPTVTTRLPPSFPCVHNVQALKPSPNQPSRCRLRLQRFLNRKNDLQTHSRSLAIMKLDRPR